MVSISKNIKRLRGERKLTQEQLAEALHVTRQTVSSWETDRTQPDVPMLAALADALETDIEDLIYGKKKHVGLEAPPAPNRRTLSLVLTIFGVLLTALGLIFMFVYFWDTLAGLMRTLLSVLPLAVGVGTGVYVLLKKKRSVFAREGAAVLWVTGLITSFALFNGLFHLDLLFRNLLLADVLLLLPVMYLLDSVFAFTAETVLSLVLLANKPYGRAGWWIPVAAAAFLVCCGYLRRNRQSAPVERYCAWVALLGFCAFSAIFSMLFTGWSLRLSIAIPYLFFLALYVADRSKRFSLRLKEPALCVLAAATYGLCVFFLFCDDVPMAPPFKETLAASLWGGLFLVAGVYFGRASFRKNPLRIIFSALFAVFIVLVFVRGGLPYWVAVGFGAAVGVLTVIAGVKIGRLLAANIGMLMLTALFWVVLLQMAEVDLLTVGAVLLVTGVIFLLVNRRLVKLQEKKKEGA